MFGIVHVPITPLKESPLHRAPMISQLLAGEIVEILDSNENWLLVMNQFDTLKGWVDRKVIEVLLDEQLSKIAYSGAGMVPAPFIQAHDQYGRSFYLPAGSRLYTHGTSIAIAPGRNLEMGVKDQLIQPRFVSRDKLIENVVAFNGAPFMCGGKSVFGIDCAGLVQIACQLNGIEMPRHIAAQMEVGEVINTVADAKPGDIAFFENTKGNVVHTGWVMDKGRIIHAYGEVRVDMLDNEGIFNKHTRQYSHKLRVIKRLFKD